MHYHVAVFSSTVILTLLIFYFTRKRLPLRSTKLFTAFLILSFINTLAEFATLYAIYHIETVPGQLNRLCHQIFIGSLDVLIYVLFLYVYAKAYRQRRGSLITLILISLPLLAALFMVIFGSLYYYIGSDGRYSYGSMATTVYISAAIYVLGVIVLLLRHKEQFKGTAWQTILCGVTIWVCIAAFQLFNPTSLLSSMAIMLMVTFLFISFENPREFRDFEIDGMLNSYAFELMLAEYMGSKKDCFLVTFTVSNEKLLKASLGYRDISEILETIFKQNSSIIGEDAFHVKENSICVLSRDKNIYRKLISNHTNQINLKNKKGISISAHYFTGILEIPLYARTSDDVLMILDYISDEGAQNQDEGLLVIDDKVIAQMNRKLSIEMLVQHAIDNDGLDVYYQPIYSTEEKAFTSAEALVRLKDSSSLGFISPEVFIPIAEKQGMIKKLGMIVFEKVCSFTAENRLHLNGVKYIEVNISGIQGVDEDLPELLRSYMNKYNIPPEFINLEITETASVTAGEMLSKNMNKLRSMGCGISMDDFGTGYSNLAKMIQTRFDLIKLDKSLVWPCFEESNRDAVILLDTCIQLIKKLNLHIVAEGVETAEQAQMLEEKGVNYLQGYYFSKPVPESSYLQFLAEHKH